MTFLSKILDQEDQHRILALLQPDPLAEHSQARGAELQESVASTSTLEQREGLSSSKQVENLIDPQEPKAKTSHRRRENTMISGGMMCLASLIPWAKELPHLIRP